MKRVYNYKSGIWKTIQEPTEDKLEFQGVPTNYKELQALSKQLGIPANQSAEDLKHQINVVLNNQ